MRKIFHSILLGYICLVFLFCTSKSHHYLVGAWDMADGKQIMIFKNDSTMSWVLNDLVVPDTFHLRYKTDETKSPNRIDIYNFKHGILVDKMLVGILDHFSKDSILLDFRPIERWADADSIRPTAFDTGTKRILVRHNK